MVGTVAPEPAKQENFVLRNPNKLILDNIPLLSHHSVNTERVATQNRGMKHTVGGWPREYDPDEPLEVAKYQKKLLRDPLLSYAHATRDLV